MPKLFRLILLDSTLSGDNFLPFIWPGGSITAFGNSRLVGYYYWLYYRLLVTIAGARLLRLTYK
jgi:hypothetical protein